MIRVHAEAARNTNSAAVEINKYKWEKRVVIDHAQSGGLCMGLTALFVFHNLKWGKEYANDRSAHPKF